ncbi:MAG: tRNA (N6-isopentenyl adenosine(37)-C2)-methylthiotransferase MiaB, partial [Clostridia bacterium]|nr:tRNA (N6-isopentenyl adenosine(37)-C2)-methylthiotransferase MiaB [Clostridia bacterium]
PSLVLNALKGGKRQFSVGESTGIAEGIPTERPISYKAWLSIMYGCNNFCTYCIVPYTRGRERSRTPGAVLAEARQLIADGAKDITLLGQNVNSYGRDRADADFPSLIRSVARLDGDFRVRFMTSHPKDASDELIRVMAEEEKIARHFHLPVQSGSDAILQRMNRRYTAEKYLGIIDRLKTAIPDVSITSDIIVGFPGETEADFEATLEMLRRVRYDMIFSFIYSPRKGTPAAEMPDQVPHEVSTARFERLLALANEISLERNQRFVGRTVRVLAEEVSRTDPRKITGRGDSPRPIHFTADPSVIGQFVNVKITDAETFSLNAELV